MYGRTERQGDSTIFKKNEKGVESRLMRFRQTFNVGKENTNATSTDVLKNCLMCVQKLAHKNKYIYI
jgi:hypothetical protein